jgi:hypothetical protein
MLYRHPSYNTVGAYLETAGGDALIVADLEIGKEGIGEEHGASSCFGGG